MAKNSPQDIENKKFFSNKFNYLLSTNNIKQTELSRILNIPKTTITGYVKGTSLPIAGNVQKIADYFNIPKSELDLRFTKSSTAIEELSLIITRLTEPRQENVLNFATEQLEEQNKENEKTKLNNEKTKLIKEEQTPYNTLKNKKDIDKYLTNLPKNLSPEELIDEYAMFNREITTVLTTEKVAAGLGYAYDEDNQLYMSYTDEYVPPHNLASLVEGDSMEPLYQDGDVILINFGNDYYSGSIYVVDYDEHSYVKKVHFKKNKVILESINEKYDDIILDYPPTDGEIKIIGKVVGSFTPLKVVKKDREY